MLTGKTNAFAGRGCTRQSPTSFRFLDELKARFDDESCPVHSFPELSLAAFGGEPAPSDDKPGDSVTDDPAVVADEHETYTIETYSVTDVVNEGCFLELQEIERLLERLRTRKNLILQGPPGTGKTWLAKRMRIPVETDHPFQCKPITDSIPSRSPIPVDADH